MGHRWRRNAGESQRVKNPWGWQEGAASSSGSPCLHPTSESPAQMGQHPSPESGVQVAPHYSQGAVTCINPAGLRDSHTRPGD